MQINTDIPTFEKLDNVVSAEIDGELVMLNMEQGRYYGMTGIAPYLWKVLDKPKTVSELVDSVCSNFDVCEETCRNDVQRFLGEMVDFGLITEGRKD